MRAKLILFGLLTALALQAEAVGFLTTNIYHVAADQIVTQEQWVVAPTARTEGTFKNDLFIACGGELTLNGIHEGNIWGAGGSTSLGGHCRRNVRLTGKTVRIDGRIDGNVLAMAETIILTTNAVVGGDVRLTGPSIVLEGEIRGRAWITAGRMVSLGGTIGEDLRIIAPEILFAPDTHIAGDLIYTTNKELVPNDDVVQGKLERIVPQRPPAFSTDQFASRILWLGAALLAGFPFIAFFPLTTAMATQLIKKVPWKCMLVGMLASIALPAFGLMCISSIIGIPLGVLLLAAWGVLAYLSHIIVGLVIGTLILRPSGASISRILLSMALGLAILYLTTMLPAIRLPVQVTTAWLGMGALILALLQKRRLIIQVPDELKQLEALKQRKKQEDPP